MSERQFAVSGTWALGADDLQWIFYKRRSQERGGWYPLSFVSSERGVLERCMQEAGVPDDDRAALLVGLPPTFTEWKETSLSSLADA